MPETLVSLFCKLSPSSWIKGHCYNLFNNPNAFELIHPQISIVMHVHIAARASTE